METPILDFVNTYAAGSTSRLHMPGHKGQTVLGCEAMDLTEIAGADALYEADGIIARSESNAATVFGSGRTLYSTEGSSQCIRAMLALACLCGNGSKTIAAARNVHRAFVYATGLLDLQVRWLYSPSERSLCTCRITPAALESALSAMPTPPLAVYVTSPDYLGLVQDIAALAQVCHAHGTLLLVDNAHGAYLRFLQPSRHPIDLGADLCCDSAHKTLPVLTGGAYLHLAKHLPAAFSDHAKSAMAMFGSTSPSYLILSSLDACNRLLAENYPEVLARTIARVNRCKEALTAHGWQVLPSDPLRLTLRCRGVELAAYLREHHIECEFADRDHLVCLFTQCNREMDFVRLTEALTAIACTHSPAEETLPWLSPAEAMSIRTALFSPQQTIPVERALGCICGAPTVGCPPAIPIVVSGEKIDAPAIAWMQHYGVRSIRVVQNCENRALQPGTNLL